MCKTPQKVPLFLKIMGRGPSLLVRLTRFKHENNALTFLSGPAVTQVSFEVAGHITCGWTGPLVYKVNGVDRELDLPTQVAVPLTLRLALRRFSRNNSNYSSYLVVKSPFTTPYEIKGSSMGSSPKPPQIPEQNGNKDEPEIIPTAPTIPIVARPVNEVTIGPYARLLQAVNAMQDDNSSAEF